MDLLRVQAPRARAQKQTTPAPDGDWLEPKPIYGIDGHWPLTIKYYSYCTEFWL